MGILFNTIPSAGATVYSGETAAATNTANTITKPELLSRAKAAVEAGEQSFHDAAEALGVAQELHGATQAEMARAIGRSEAWVSLLLRWRRSAYTGNSPFGPTTKADRLKHAKDRAASGKSRSRKSGNQHPAASTEAPTGVVWQPTPEPAQEASSGAMLGSPEAPDHSSTVTGEPKPAEPRSAGNQRGELLHDFTSAVMGLIRTTKNREAKRFAKTAVPADDLARLGKLLTDLANLKKSGAFKPTATVISYGNVAVSPEQSAEEMKAKHAALDAAA
jgi:hypothetical protein